MLQSQPGQCRLQEPGALVQVVQSCVTATTGEVLLCALWHPMPFCEGTVELVECRMQHLLGSSLFYASAGCSVQELVRYLQMIGASGLCIPPVPAMLCWHCFACTIPTKCSMKESTNRLMRLLPISAFVGDRALLKMHLMAYTLAYTIQYMCTEYVCATVAWVTGW